MLTFQKHKRSNILIEMLHFQKHKRSNILREMLHYCLQLQSLRTTFLSHTLTYYGDCRKPKRGLTVVRGVGEGAGVVASAVGEVVGSEAEEEEEGVAMGEEVEVASEDEEVIGEAGAMAGTGEEAGGAMAAAEVRVCFNCFCIVFRRKCTRDIAGVALS